MQIERELIQNVAAFGALSAQAIDYLLQRAEQLSSGSNSFVFREGDPAQSVYILESGRLAVLKGWGGRQYLLCHLEPGACFGEMALMDMHPRSASVLSVSDSTIWKIDASCLLELYQQDPEQFMLLQMNLGREVSRRLREADERMFRWRLSPEALRELPAYEAFSDVPGIDPAC